MMGFNQQPLNLSPRTILIFGVGLIFFAIVLGAFGAHGLKAMLDETKMNTFKTGVEYQYYHGFGLLFLGLLKINWPELRVNKVFAFMLVGVIFFCSNCYLYALTGVKIFGILVPIGGVSFLIAWFLLFMGLKRIGR
ncbi:MAG: DUF423 domain-containing protein [Bacteriovoracaceae bacterium]